MEKKQAPEGFYNAPSAPVGEQYQRSAPPNSAGFPPPYAAMAPPPSYNEALSHPVPGQGPAVYYQQVSATQMGYYGAPPVAGYTYAYPAHPASTAMPVYSHQAAGGKRSQPPGAGYPQQVVMAPAAFDAGARFDSTSQVRVPPPPPGVAPNAAQLAAMSGQTAAVGQKKGSWLSGGSSGGYTFW